MRMMRMSWQRSIFLMLGIACAPMAVAQGPGNGAGGGRGGNPQAILDRMDANKDGKISAEEFTGPRARFDAMDANKDGSVTLEEITAARANNAGPAAGAPGAGGPGAMGQGGRGGNFDPAAIQQRQMDNLKTQLAASESEWTALQPKLQKVLAAQSSANQYAMRGFGRMMGMGGRGGRGGAGAPGAGAPGAGAPGAGAPGAGPAAGGRGGQGGRGGMMGMPQVAEVQALNQSVENASSTDADLTAKLSAFRAARDKADAALKAAREDLRKGLKVRQEAVLVSAGVLD